MDKQLRKRLEEAANDYAENHGFRIPYDGSNDFYDEIDVKASKDGFLAGAEWKDQQFKEYLEKKRNRIAEIDTKDYKGWEMYYMADITEIINELFKEE